MNKFLLFIIILFSFQSITQAQIYNDGCMNMTVVATSSWNEEYEDPFFDDESSWQWSIADNGDIDGAGYIGGACLQQGGHFQIGWWNHTDYTINNFSYGPLNSPNPTLVSQYLNLRGRYEGDDCGGNCDHNNGGVFTCFGDQDDYIFNDLVSSFIDYRFAAPNNNNIFQRFTNWHGSADYGGEFIVNYTSPRPNTATTSHGSICADGSSGAVTLETAGATFGGSYEWYVGAAFDYVGSGSSIVVDPILDANGGTSVVYHVYTKNGIQNSLCYKDITIDIINCDFNCTSSQNTVVNNIPQWFDNYNFGGVTTSGFPAGSYITDVNVSTSFVKNNPNNDIGFELLASASGTSCTSTSLVNGQFAGDGQALASVLFDEQSSNSVVSGTYDPQFTSIMDPSENLSCYNWFDPNRNWNLIVDHAGTSFFQVAEFEVEVCACKPPTSASITESGTNSITICETQGGTLELNISGSLGALDAAGFGDEVRWFQDVCYTGPFVGSGNPFTITAPTSPGTYTYYANYYIEGVPCDIPSIIANECQSITIVVTEEAIAGSVVQGGAISIDICKNTSPGLFTLVGSNQIVPGINIVRWEVSSNGGINWSPISNILPTYNPGILPSVGIYYYRAVLTNVGCGDSYSGFIIVNVFETPIAGTTTMLTTGNTYCSDTLFRMSTSGYLGALQWQVSSDNGLTYADIPSQSSDDLTYWVSNNTELAINYLFRVKSTNLPCSYSYSIPAESITIYPATQGGVLSTSQDVCSNNFATDLDLVNVYGDSIIWEMDDNMLFSSPTDLGHVQKVIGLDNTLAGTTIGMLTTTQYIRAKIINAYCTESYSNIVTLTSFGSQPIPFALNIDSVFNTSCFGQNDGSIYLGTVGGATPFLFSIDGVNYQVDSVFTGLVSGLYTVYTIDSNGCMATSSATIVESPQLVVNLDSVNSVLCNGQSTGTAYLSVSGGAGVYTYLWSNSSINQNLENVPEGSYNVLVSSGACSSSLNLTISEPTILSANLVSVSNVSCNGETNGSIDVSVSGGTSNYTFSWSDGSSVVGISEDLAEIVAGTYTLTIADNNSCTTTVMATISENTLLTGTISSTDILCFAEEGLATVSVTGGLAPYTYLWSNFDTSSTAINLSEGMSSVIITDALACTVQLFDTIYAPFNPIEISAVTQTVSCFGLNDGSITELITGGTGFYTVTWSPGGTNTNLTAGVYTIDVIDTNGCTASESYTITEPTQISTSISVSNPTCFNDQTGMAVAGVANGTAPFTFSWNTVPVQLGMVAVNLLGDVDYTATITDANGCIAYDTAKVINPTELILNTILTSVSCISNSNGSVIIQVQGTDLPYEYQLNGFLQVDSVFNNLAVGNYVVFVTDNTNCSASTSFTISSASSMQVEIEAAGNDMNFITDHLYIVNGEEVSLNVNFINDSGNPIVSYNWIPLDIETIRNPTFMPIDNVTVQVEVLEMINGNICSVFDTIQINVSQESLIFIPTAFSPNNAGQNNFFEMNVLGAENLNVQIFNRWGEEVFSNANQENGPNNINDASLIDGTNPRNAWDGKYKKQDVPKGSYAYKVEVTYFDGSTKLIKGSVTVIR